MQGWFTGQGRSCWGHPRRAMTIKFAVRYPVSVEQFISTSHSAHSILLHVPFKLHPRLCLHDSVYRFVTSIITDAVKCSNNHARIRGGRPIISQQQYYCRLGYSHLFIYLFIYLHVCRVWGFTVAAGFNHQRYYSSTTEEDWCGVGNEPEIRAKPYGAACVVRFNVCGCMLARIASEVEGAYGGYGCPKQSKLECRPWLKLQEWISLTCN